jgi:hypothetical protein
VGLRRDDEALASYRLAEAMHPSSQAKLTLAKHLLYSLGEPQEALVKAEEGLALSFSEIEARLLLSEVSDCLKIVAHKASAWRDEDLVLRCADTQARFDAVESDQR